MLFYVSLRDGTFFQYRKQKVRTFPVFWRLDQHPRLNTETFRDMFLCFTPKMRLQASSEHGSSLCTPAWHGLTTKPTLWILLGLKFWPSAFPPFWSKPLLLLRCLHSQCGRLCSPLMVVVSCKCTHCWWSNHHCFGQNHVVISKIWAQNPKQCSSWCIIIFLLKKWHKNCNDMVNLIRIHSQYYTVNGVDSNHRDRLGIRRRVSASALWGT